MARIKIGNQYIEDHGILIDAESLERVCKYTEKVYRGYIQLSYDREDGTFLADYHDSTENWTVYRDRSIIGIGGTTRHLSKQSLVDMAFQQLQGIRQYGLL